MAEFGVEGQDLKKMLKKAKAEPIAFGFNPGKSDDESYLAMHPRKTAEVLGKDAREEGEGGKYSFGMAQLVGKELRLTCLRELPGMAKRLKKFLKSQKVMLNVVLLDENGNVLESEIEEGLPDDPELDGDDVAEPADEATAEDVPEAPPPPDAAELSRRLTALRERIGTLAPEAQGRVAGPFKQLVEMLKGGNLLGTATGLDRLEQAVATLAGMAPATAAAPAAPPAPPGPDAAALTKRLTALRERIGTLAPEAQGRVAGPFKQLVDLLKGGNLEATATGLDRLEQAVATLAAATPAAPPPNPALARLEELVAGLRERAEALGDANQRTRIMGALDTVATLLKAGNAEQAAPAIKRIQDALAALAGAPAPAGETAPEKTGTEGASAEEWERRFGAIEADVYVAMSQGLVQDLDRFRLDVAVATESADAGDYAKALSILPRIEEALKQGRADGDTAFLENVPPDAKPFAMARIEWAKARARMQSEVGRIAQAVVAEAAQDADLADAATNVAVLTRNVDKLDSRLEDAMDAIVNAAADARAPLKAAAQKLIDEYQQELAAPFFQDIDAGSGFGNVAVTSTARTALAEIARVLA